MFICSTCRENEILQSGGRCSGCNKIYMAEYRKNNLEKIKNAQKNHYQRNALVVKEKVKKYAKLNIETVKKTKEKYYQTNKNVIKVKVKQWKEKNKERSKELSRASCLNRVARKRNAPGKYTVQDVRNLYDSQKGKCACCDLSILDGYHVDHKIPLSRGGGNWPENLQLLFPSCNRKKHDKTMEEFLEHKRKYNV